MESRAPSLRMLGGQAAAVCTAVLAGLLLAGIGAETRASQQGGVLLVTATDKGGAIVGDLAPGDVEVKVGGKVAPVAGVARSTAPLRIAVLVSDRGTGAFQLGLAKFAEKLLDRASFGFVSVLVQPDRLGDYGRGLDHVLTSVRRLGPRGRPNGAAQLVEAIADASQHVVKEGERPVIVVLRLGGEAPSEVGAKQVLAALQKSRALLYVVGTPGASRPPASQASGVDPGDNMAMARAQFSDSEASEAQMNLAMILGDGARLSGGRQESVVSTTTVPVMEGLAEELLNQYEVTYTIPAGAKPTDRVTVSAKRKGVTLRAPTR